MVAFFQSSPPYNEVGIRAFSLDHPSGEFKEVGLQLTEAGPDTLCQALEGDNHQAGFWTNPDFNFLDTPVGKHRLRQDVRELKQAGFKPALHRVAGRCIFLLKIRTWELICIPAREYPITPPRFYWKHTSEEVAPLRSLTTWNSDHSILMTVKEIRRKLGSRYHTRKWRRHKPSFWKALLRKADKWIYTYSSSILTSCTKPVTTLRSTEKSGPQRAWRTFWQ